MKFHIFNTCIAPVFLLLSTFAGASTTHREALEQFDLQTLQFYSASQVEKCGWTVSVIDPNGFVHYARIGNYLGKNKGQIKRITKDAVTIDEIKADEKGEQTLQTVTVRVGK